MYFVTWQHCQKEYHIGTVQCVWSSLNKLHFWSTSKVLFTAYSLYWCVLAGSENHWRDTACYLDVSIVREWHCHICSLRILQDHVTSSSHRLLLVVIKKTTSVKCGIIRPIIFQRRIQKQTRKLRGNHTDLLKAGKLGIARTTFMWNFSSGSALTFPERFAFHKFFIQL